MHMNVCITVKLVAGFLQCNGKNLEETKATDVCSSLTVCLNQNRLALLPDLLSNNSFCWSVGHTHTLNKHSFLFLTTDRKTVYYSTNHH